MQSLGPTATETQGVGATGSGGCEEVMILESGPADGAGDCLGFFKIFPWRGLQFSVNQGGNTFVNGPVFLGLCTAAQGQGNSWRGPIGPVLGQRNRECGAIGDTRGQIDRVAPGMEDKFFLDRLSADAGAENQTPGFACGDLQRVPAGGVEGGLVTPDPSAA